jgi:arabinogalactan oligomer/maltooligosaccharide transport system permease protein
MSVREKGSKPKSSEKAPKKSKHSLYDSNTTSTKGWVFKIVLLGLIDAIAVFAGFMLVLQHQWLPLGLEILAVGLLNWVYLKRGSLPAKYLAPGVIFLIAFQISVLIFSFFTAFTNYSSAHNGDIKWATAAILDANFGTAEDAPSYKVVWLKDDKGRPAELLSRQDFVLDPTTGEVVLDSEGAAVTVTTDIYVGVQGHNLQAVDRSTVTWSQADPTGKPCTDLSSNCGIATMVPGFTALDISTLSSKQSNKLFTLKFWKDSSHTAFVNLAGGLEDAVESTQILRFSNPHDDYSNPSFTKIADPSMVYKPSADGYYRLDGKIKGDKASETGWEVFVGGKNLGTIFGDQKLREPLLKIISWTIVFAVLSVLTTFIVGLAISLLFDDERMRGKKIYRSIMILPYAFPGFLSAYVWKGLFNQKYGFINTVILGQTNGAVDMTAALHNTPWLVDGTMAKIAVLMVNLWLGFPYMFLITTGALQAIPAELTESATIDGATPSQILRLIKMPLLLVSLAPLLISSFAFNFNNFSIIYLLTGGGPTNTATGYDAGETDILITFVYKIAFSTGTGRDYGLASAFSILIFLVVGTMSLISFRRTKFLEDIN